MKFTGKQLAIWGLFFEIIFFISLLYTIVAIMNAFSSMATAGSVELSSVAPQLSKALYPSCFTFPIATIGDLFLLLALFKYQYRSKWFLCVMWVLSILWLPRIPIGTVLGIITMVRLIKQQKRTEPEAVADGTDAG